MNNRNSRAIEKYNTQIANTQHVKGQLDGLGWYLCPNGLPRNFIISGGITEERYAPIVPFLVETLGKQPMIILHNHNQRIENIAAHAYHQLISMGQSTRTIVAVNSHNSQYEPFLGMRDTQVVSCLRQLATEMGYTVTPAFERIVHAHLVILKELSISTSLSGLHYLCQFRDMGEFHHNILALPCGEEKAKLIWADISTGADGMDSQLDLFRAVIDNLAGEAERSGWSPTHSVGTVACSRAIGENATLLLAIDDLNADLFMSYLVEELRAVGRKDYFLLIDGVKLNNRFFEYLRSSSGSQFGLISENAIELLDGNQDTFLRLAERVECFLLFKHATGKTAAVLSEVIGKSDHVKAEESRGKGRGYFDILPQNRHDDVRLSVENRYRVMPEEIIRLIPGQAIIFDTFSDQVVHFNG